MKKSEYMHKDLEKEFRSSKVNDKVMQQILVFCGGDLYNKTVLDSYTKEFEKNKELI